MTELGRKRGKAVKGPNWVKIFGIIFAIVLGVVILGAGGIFFLGHNLINMTNYVADHEVQVVDAEMLPEEAIETLSTEESVGIKVDQARLQEIHQSMDAVSGPEAENNIQQDESVFNFLLAGVDRRDKSWNGNSDSMMLVSINSKNKQVSIISLMRDLYVNIPGVGYQKLNNAYARGGGALLTETVSNSFDIELDKYAAVDFENMIEIVDALRGIDLQMSAAEIEVANGYMLDMCNTLGLDGYEYQLPVADGTYHCNGIQAVAYARNRFVGNSDYARTERQRYVISQILKRVKTMGIAEITSFAMKVLPLVTHNFSEKEIWSLMRQATDIMGYDFRMDRIPYDNQYEVIYVGAQDMLVPNWQTTVAQLHETLYGSGAISTNYDNNESSPASAGQSADISQNTGAETAVFANGTDPADALGDV